MTRPIHAYHHQRPRRIIGKALRSWLSCPMCRQKLRVVGPYREHGERLKQSGKNVKVLGLTVRLECSTCRLRFSVRVRDVAQARRRLLRRDRESLGGNDASPGSLAAETVARIDEELLEANNLEILAVMHPKDPPETRKERASIYQTLFLYDE